MGVSVGSIINVMKAWNTYQDRLAYYNSQLTEAKASNNPSRVKYWNDTISMTEMEIGEFLNIVI